MGSSMTFCVERSQGLTASGNEDGSVTFVTEKTTSSYKIHNDAVWDIEFSPDSKFLATASIGKTVAIIDPKNGKILKRLKDHQDAVYSVNFSKDSERLVTASLDGTAIVL